MDIATIRANLEHSQTRCAECERGLARSSSDKDKRYYGMWVDIYSRESSTLARMLREALQAVQAEQAAKLARHARFIAEHDCAAVVELSATTLTVCGSYTRWLASGRKVTGFRVERIANTRAAAREYLGY